MLSVTLPEVSNTTVSLDHVPVLKASIWMPTSNSNVSPANPLSALLVMPPRLLTVLLVSLVPPSTNWITLVLVALDSINPTEAVWFVLPDVPLALVLLSAPPVPKLPETSIATAHAPLVSSTPEPLNAKLATPAVPLVPMLLPASLVTPENSESSETVFVSVNQVSMNLPTKMEPEAVSLVLLNVLTAPLVLLTVQPAQLLKTESKDMTV